jgi:PhnB protein
MQIKPYLFFEGRAEEAIEFYKSALGAKVEMMMRYKEAPEPPDPEKCSPTPGSGDKVMHACLQIGETTVMLSDGMCQGQPEFKGIALSIHAKDATEAKRFFSALADGGQVRMPLDRTFFSPQFGMVADRFGVLWMVLVPQ